MDELKFEILKGKTLKEIKVNDDKDEMEFYTDSGEAFKLYHSQDCCECVEINDICGDLDDLIGSEILQAEEVCNEQDKNPPEIEKIPERQDSFTWTFYKLATIKGYVTIRWYGESNGYYSEEVDFCRI